MKGRSAAVARTEGSATAWRAVLARPYAVVVGIWAVWAGAVIATVAIGIAAGAYARSRAVPGTPLFPLFSWDFGWYERIAQHGYAAVADRRYAFFPLWPWLLRASGPVADWKLAGAVALAASALAFLGVAAGSPAGRPRHAALALACWPGSFALLLAYPDGLALAAAAWAAALVLRERPLLAAPLGAAAALLRPNGLLIALPLAWLARGRDWRYKLAAAAPVAAGVAVELFFWTRSGHVDAFFHAQRLWGRKGPTGIGHWADHVRGRVDSHPALIAVLLVVAVAAVVFAWRRFGPLTTAAVAYVCAVPLLLASTHSLQGFVDSARAVLVLPLLVVLWRMDERYRPWAAFATAVVALLLGSGLMQSFGRQSLYAFPIFWALGEGPAWLRRPPLAALGFAANLAIALLLTRFAP
ncbi:MAG: hypothetical protein ACXVRE_05295 [Gaiellaceae bacterium]